MTKPTKEKATAATPDMTAQYRQELRNIGKAERDLNREIKRSTAATNRDLAKIRGAATADIRKLLRSVDRVATCAIANMKARKRTEAKLNKGWTKLALKLVTRRQVLEGRLS